MQLNINSSLNTCKISEDKSLAKNVRGCITNKVANSPICRIMKRKMYPLWGPDGRIICPPGIYRDFFFG